ncbi:hypothetical protein PTKIN_Ptkin05aG0128800 [Pterospermum kingtungense]
MRDIRSKGVMNRSLRDNRSFKDVVLRIQKEVGVSNDSEEKTLSVEDKGANMIIDEEECVEEIIFNVEILGNDIKWLKNSVIASIKDGVEWSEVKPLLTNLDVFRKARLLSGVSFLLTFQLEDEKDIFLEKFKAMNADKLVKVQSWNNKGPSKVHRLWILLEEVPLNI